MELWFQTKNFYLFRYLTKVRFGIDWWIDVFSCDFSHHKLDISQFFEVKIALLNIWVILEFRWSVSLTFSSDSSDCSIPTSFSFNSSTCFLYCAVSWESPAPLVAAVVRFAVGAAFDATVDFGAGFLVVVVFTGAAFGFGAPALERAAAASYSSP